jgi:DNA (cytosine-5)-methyltransferase 1
MANKIKAIDLFSGCGGVSCGLTNMKFAVKAAVEIDKNAAETYRTIRH